MEAWEDSVVSVALEVPCPVSKCQALLRLQRHPALNNNNLPQLEPLLQVGKLSQTPSPVLVASVVSVE